MISVVNGFVCRTCCDVSLARHGHDPRNPHDDPVRAATLAVTDGKALPGSSSGAIDRSSRMAGAGPSPDDGRPEPSARRGQLGRIVDILA